MSGRDWPYDWRPRVSFEVAGGAESSGEAVLVEVSAANGAGNCLLSAVHPPPPPLWPIPSSMKSSKAHALLSVIAARSIIIEATTR